MCAAPHREPDYPKLNNQPLTLVLVDIRTTSVLKLAEYIPDIQEAIRPQLPDFYVQSTPALRVGPHGPSQTGQQDAWVFRNRQYTQALVLHQDGILFFSSVYDRFPGFLETLEKYIRIVETTVSPGQVTRVGLRYNDLISPNQGEALSDYVMTPFAPAPQDDFSFSQQLLRHRAETRFATKRDEYLKIGCLAGYLDSAVMPDLFSPLPVKIQRSVDSKHVSAVLDFDHYWHPEEGIDFVADDILAQANSLHNDAIAAFFEITTEWARTERWS